MSLVRQLILLLTLQHCYGWGSSRGSSSGMNKAQKKASDERLKIDACQNRVSLCNAVTGSVGANLIRPYACEGLTHPCMVVVNDNITTVKQCNEWSPYSHWDGTLCMSRCELLGGVKQSSMNQSWCYLNGRAVINFKSYAATNEALIDSAIVFGVTMSDYLFLAPIQCGTWLGVRDSASNSSWFSSSCFSIFDNRNNLTSDAKISPCGINKYTTGCRFIGPWVPECRNSNLDECGVQLPCAPVINPCDLGISINSNLHDKFSACDSVTHLAMNFTATPSNCYQWNVNAFVLDGRCVSSCGIVDHQCTLNGVTVPVCRATRDYGGALINVTPAICSVPMRADAYSGVRNGFYGMSRVPGSKCLYSTQCANSSSCIQVEGLNVSLLPPFEQTNALPVCMGYPLKPCKIEYPCPIIPVPFECATATGAFKVSEAIYSRFGIYNCIWFQVRDGVIIYNWICAILTACYVPATPSHIVSELLTKSHMNHGCSYFFLYLLSVVFLGGLACVWEFLILVVCVACFVACFVVRTIGPIIPTADTRYSNGTEVSPNKDPAAVLLETGTTTVLHRADSAVEIKENTDHINDHGAVGTTSSSIASWFGDYKQSFSHTRETAFKRN